MISKINVIFSFKKLSKKFIFNNRYHIFYAWHNNSINRNTPLRITYYYDF